MTTTDELRAELTRRGVEYELDAHGVPQWRVDSSTAYVHEMGVGLGCALTIYPITPERAVDMTMRCGECHRVRGRKSYRAYGGYRIECSECGYGLADMRYRFCPNCGRRIEEDE